MKNKDFRIDGFYPSYQLMDLLWKSQKMPGIIEQYKLMFFFWSRGARLSTPKASYFRGIQKSLGEIMAAFFTALAIRAQEENGRCEPIECSEKGGFKEKYAAQLIERLNLDYQKESVIETLSTLYWELARHLAENPWSSSVIQVSYDNFSITIGYLQPFSKPDWKKIMEDGQWEEI